MVDVAAQIIAWDWITKEQCYLTVRWWNIHGYVHFKTRPYPIDDDVEVLKLSRDDVEKFKPFKVEE
jgi:hypothetical protein